MTTTTAPPRWRVPFHRTSIDEASIEEVVAVLRSGWLTTGAQCSAFEAEFATFLGGDVEAIAVTSGTAALHLALDAVGIRAGDLVITSPYTFTATAEVVRYLGAHPVFADVDPVTGNLTRATVDTAVARLTPDDQRRVRAILPVHFAGLPCDLTALGDLALRRGWAVVDDAAHALPAAHAGRSIGAQADVSAFSFYATKPLCTGEGGMVTTRNRRLAARMRTMRLHGIDRDVFRRYEDAAAWYYEVVEAGFKYNLTDIAAALGRAQLRRQHELWMARAAVAAAYDAAFADVDGLLTPPDAAPGDTHARHLYPLRVLGGRPARDAFVERLADVGIAASVHFIPLYLQPYYRRTYGLRATDFPGATTLFDQEVSLPLYPDMTAEEVGAVIDAVRQAVSDVGQRPLARSGP